MLDCRQVLDELANYLDDETAASIRQQLEEHLEHCRPCRVLVDSTRKTIQIVTECGSFEMPVDLSSKIMARVRGKA